MVGYHYQHDNVQVVYMPNTQLKIRRSIHEGASRTQLYCALVGIDPLASGA